MEYTITNPLLSPTNEQAIYKMNDELYWLDGVFEEGRLLLQNMEESSHFKWSLDGQFIGFIQKGQLKVFSLKHLEVVVAPFEGVSQFDWALHNVLYVTASNEKHLYKWDLNTCEAQLVIQNVQIEALYPEGNTAIVNRGGQLYYAHLMEDKEPELQIVTAEPGQYSQVALSFDGQYVAYIGESEYARNLFIYHFEDGLTQNLTEMLDVYAGDAMDPQASKVQGVKEIQWIETNALYFLLAGDGDVRLYYADLYGSLFPASPENEHVCSYSVATSGNWALYTANSPFVRSELKWFDITMGEGRRIEGQSVEMELPIETTYDILELEGQIYYVWGYLPNEWAKAVVVVSGYGRMVGNNYDDHLVNWLHNKTAVFYINHPGTLGYGIDYAKMILEQELQQEKVEEIVANSIGQKFDCVQIEVLYD